MMTQISQTIQLGRTDIRLSPMGIGTWAWGDRFFWAYGETHTDEDITDAFKIGVEAGINFFDTASIYGFGNNERLLKDLIATTDKNLIISSKLFPLPWRASKRSILRGVEGSTKRLGFKPINLYQQHWPFPPLSIEKWMGALAQAHDRGLILAIGGSNFNVKHMKRAINELNKYGLHLASNQVHFSLLHRTPEFNGIFDICREHNITLVAYSPLGQGLLTGKYKPSGVRPKGMMRLGGRKIIERVQPLVEQLRQIGKNHGGKTPAQVAINWVICRGVLPLVGAKNASQMKENLGALGWELSEEEISTLDEASEKVQISFPMESLVGLS